MGAINSETLLGRYILGTMGSQCLSICSVGFFRMKEDLALAAVCSFNKYSSETLPPLMQIHQGKETKGSRSGRCRCNQVCSFAMEVWSSECALCP